MSGRVWCSLWATLAGWLAAMLLTALLFEVPELWRNAPPGGVAHDLVSGLTLWAAFTLAVCGGVWCVVALPLALLVPPEPIVRWRWKVSLGAAVGAVVIVGWRLGTWGDLLNPGPLNPLTAPLFLAYAGFAFTLAWVTTMVYARLLRTQIKQ